MADETRTANVELTANVSQYQQSTQQAYQNTNKLTDSVNKLAASLDGITKRMGKKLVLFGTADLAAMTAYLAVAAKHEKQLATIRAQTELTNKSYASYVKSIDAMSRALPVAGERVTALTTQISKLGVTSEKSVMGMVKAFTQLGAATGEDIGALTQGLIELSRQMGTLGNGANGIKNFSDSLTTISTNAGVSATAVLSFAQAIAPMARAAGIGQKEVLGISTAFTKAGADGFAAANTFNTMVSDITRQVMNGSPQIAKYSNVIGVTVDQFRRMDAAERVVQIFEAVNKAGPDSIKILDRLGFDGIRAAKSIQAVAAEQGGLRKAIEQSVGAYGNGATQRGSDVAFDTLDARVTKFRNNMEQIGAAIGEGVMPFAKGLLDVFNKMLEVVNAIAKPLLTMSGFLGTILGGLTTIVGTLMTALGPLSQLMVGLTLFRLSPVRGLIEGFRTARGADPERAAARGLSEGRWYQQGPYRAGRYAGGLLPEPGRGFGGGMVGRVARWGLVENSFGMAVRQQADWSRQMYNNAAMRDYWNRYSPVGHGIGVGATRVSDLARAAIADPRAFMTGLRTKLSDAVPNLKGKGDTVTTEELAAAQAKLTNATNLTTNANRQAAEAAVVKAKSDLEAAKLNATFLASQSKAKLGADMVSAAETKLAEATNVLAATQVRASQEIAAAAGVAARGMARTALASGAMGLRAGVQGIGAGLKGLGSMAAGMIGLSPELAIPLAIAGGGAYALKQSNDAAYKNIINDETMTNIGPTNAALGLATESLKQFTFSVKAGARTVEQLTDVNTALKLNNAERLQAQNADKYNDERVAGLTNKESAVAFMQSMGQLNPQQARSLAMDMTKRFGAVTASQITGDYSSVMSRAQFDTMDISKIANPLFASGIQRTNEGPVGWLRNAIRNPLVSPLGSVLNLIPGDDNASEAVKSAWVASDQNIGDIQGKYGDRPAAAKLQANILGLMTGAFANTNTAGGMGVLEQNIKQFEGKYGQLGLTTGPNGVFKKGVGQISTVQDFYKLLFNPNNQDEGAQGFRQAAATAGLGANDLIGAGADPNKAAIALQRGNISDFERRVRSSDIGAFARNNSIVRDVTEGNKIGNNEAIGQAIDQMVNAATKGGTTFDQATTEFQKIKAAVNDVNDPLYQLASAAQAAAERLGAIQAREQGGMVGSIVNRWNTVNAKLRTVAPGDERNALLAEREDTYTQARDAAQQYADYIKNWNKNMIRTKRDFNKQMMYADQDFALQQKRMAQDVAKTMYDPFSRVVNMGAASAGTLLRNLKDQNQIFKTQMRQLKKLKGWGLSQESIDMLGLVDPAKWAQVDELYNEFQMDKGLAGQFNKQTAQRGKLASAWATSSENQEWARTEENFKTARKRQRDAFQTSLNDALKDFLMYGQETYGNLDTIMGVIDKRLAKTGKLLKTTINAPFDHMLDKFTKANIQLPGAPITPTSFGTAAGYGGGWGMPLTVPDINSAEGLGSGFSGSTSNIDWTRPGYDKATGKSSDYDARGVRVGSIHTPTVFRGGGTTYNNVTNFSINGDIKANDPNEMARQLVNKARLKSLRQGQNAKIE